MKINVLKVITFILVVCVSVVISTTCINNHIVAVKNEQKTIADALIKKQAQEMMKEAEEKIRQAKEDENLTIETEKIEIKPPVIEPDKSKNNDSNDQSESIDTGENKENADHTNDSNDKNSENADKDTVANMIESDENQVGMENPEPNEGNEADIDQNGSSKIVIEGIGEFDTLDDKAMQRIEKYLVENYFLDGYKYVASETDDKLREEKMQACELENYVVRSIYEMYGLVDILTSMNFSGFDAIRQSFDAIRSEFSDKYKDKDYSEELAGAVDETARYFDLADTTLDKFSEMIDNINNSPNALLALTSALTTLQTEIKPAINDVINAGINIKEVTNPIYLKGIEGKKLLSKEEVLSIINIIEENMF